MKAGDPLTKLLNRDDVVMDPNLIPLIEASCRTRPAVPLTKGYCCYFIWSSDPAILNEYPVGRAGWTRYSKCGVCGEKVIAWPPDIAWPSQ